MTSNRGNPGRPQAQHRRRNRREGVPVMLVIVLLIMALLMGALGGFFVARRTDTHVHELQAANDRITELENTLTMIGFPLDDGVDPEQWAYDNAANETALQDLTGEGWGDEEDEADLWDDDSLIGATLPEDSEPVVVAEFEGGQLLSNEVIPEYNDRLTTLIFAGYSADDVAQETMDNVLKDLAGDKIVALKAQELGMTELSEDDLAKIREEAAANYEAQLNDYLAFAEDGETRESAAQRLEEESGVTLESVTESVKANWWTQKYFDYIVKDVTVTDEEVQARYDALITRQKEEFTEYPEEFEYAHQMGQLIVYRPEGFRAVRDILIPFSDEDEKSAADLTEQIELGTAPDDVQKQLDALYAPLEKTAQEIQDKLNDGQSFQDLMAEYGVSDALRDEPMRTEGYYITGTSFVNSTEYVEGSMMLEQPGQVSAPLRSPSGLHLVEYVGDLAPGDVPLDEIQDAVKAEALKQKQDEYYEQQREALLEAAQVKYYPERLR